MASSTHWQRPPGATFLKSLFALGLASRNCSKVDPPKGESPSYLCRVPHVSRFSKRGIPRLHASGAFDFVGKGTTSSRGARRQTNIAASAPQEKSPFPIWKRHQGIVIRSLARHRTSDDTPHRARGATVAQHSVQVADAGSNPAGSILPSVEKIYPGRERRDNLPK